MTTLWSPSADFLPIGIESQLQVCSSIANIGSGFDSVGIGLGIYDQIKAEIMPQGLEIIIQGEGEDNCTRDETHLVYQGLKQILGRCGMGIPGLYLECINSIPQARGLGSSAAAYVGGLALGAKLLIAAGYPPPAMAELIDLAGIFEGHADNSSASILGGAVISWKEGDRFHATNISLCPDIQIYVCIPLQLGYTSEARGVLPELVPRMDAVFNLSRSALLVHALTKDPQLLFDATDDVLHQPYRRNTQSESYALVNYFRGCGLAACIAGAGPTVAVLAVDEQVKETIVSAAGKADFTVIMPAIGQGLSGI